VPAVGGRSALGTRCPGRCRAPGVRREAANGLIEPFAVFLTQVNLILPAVDAEPADPVLAVRYLFLVVVTRICDRYFLSHHSPLPSGEIYPAASRSTVTTPRSEPYGGHSKHNGAHKR